MPLLRYRQPVAKYRGIVLLAYEWLLIARFMGPTWGPPGAARTQVGPMLSTQPLLSGTLIHIRWSRDRLRFIMRIPIGGKETVLILKHVCPFALRKVMIYIFDHYHYRYGKSCFRSRRGRSKNKRGRSSASDKAPPYDEEPVEGYETYVTRCPVDLYTHAWEVTRPILDRDVTLITDDVHKAHMMATYCTKECQNACTFKGCRKHPTDTYGTSTYGRPETHETATVDPTRYFEHQDPQLWDCWSYFISCYQGI